MYFKTKDVRPMSCEETRNTAYYVLCFEWGWGCNFFITVCVMKRKDSSRVKKKKVLKPPKIIGWREFKMKVSKASLKL